MEHLPIPKPLSVNTLKFFRVPTPQHGKKLRIAIDLDSTLVNYTYLCTAAASLLDVPCAPTQNLEHYSLCLLYTSPSPRDRQKSRMPSSA